MDRMMQRSHYIICPSGLLTTGGEFIQSFHCNVLKAAVTGQAKYVQPFDHTWFD
jgi:hypothetical protein